MDFTRFTKCSNIGIIFNLNNIGILKEFLHLSYIVSLFHVTNYLLNILNIFNLKIVVIFKSDFTTNIDILLDNLLFENVKIDMAAHPDLQVGADGYFMKGTYQATELNPDGTNLFLGDNNTFFRPSENDHRMKGTRVYFIIPRKAVDQVLSYDTETIVDGIVDVEVNSQSNSQKVYNINGVYVGDNLRNLTPGVYIVSGKKVVVTNR